MLGLYPRKGTLQVGSDADIVVFDPNGKTEIAEASPYAKVNTAGRVEIVIRRGEVVADGGHLIDTASAGQEVKSEAVELKK
jgi:dihydropyrimidinase